ncbi:glutathione S-transferase family protein [Pseudomonadota bacterium]|nr:glutathione S-transferase family protein [Pseudomonadota bacterium]
MIKLYGFAVSNWYNIIKYALIEKGLEFEEVHALPSQDEAFKLKSPMGKVPFIETEEGYCSESMAILEYLEKLKPSPSLTASSPFEAAKIHEIARVLDLYIETPARRHFGEIFFGGERDETAFKEAKPVIEKGLKALNQLASFDAYLCGEFSYADIIAMQVFAYVAPVCQAVYGWDVIAEVPGLQATIDLINKRDAGKIVAADQAIALEAFNESKG